MILYRITRDSNQLTIVEVEFGRYGSTSTEVYKYDTSEGIGIQFKDERCRILDKNYQVLLSLPSQLVIYINNDLNRGYNESRQENCKE